MSLTDVPPSPLPLAATRVPWRGVIEALDEVLLVLNAQSVVAYASPSVRALGYAPERLAGRSLGDLVHPDDLRAALRHLAEVPSAGAVRLAMRVLRADGDHAWLECVLTRAGDPSDVRGLTVLTGRDGGTRALLADRLADVDLRFRTLLAAVGEPVVFVDGELRVEEVNDEAAILLGCSPQELLGRRWFDVLDVCDETGRRLDSDGPFATRLVVAPALQEVWRTLIRRDGSSLFVRERWTPLDGGSGGHRGYVVTLRDGLTGGTAPSVPQQRRQARTAAGLTPREHEVLERLADGQDAMEIARRLGLSVYSVRGHIKSLMRKLGVHSQLQAVVVAARRGLVDVVRGHGSSQG